MAKNELLLLTYHHYDRGPTPDHMGDGSDIWEFGKPIDNEMAYIKLKIKNNHCVVETFQKDNAEIIREKSHEEMTYTETDMKKLIPYNYTKSLTYL